LIGKTVIVADDKNNRSIREPFMDQEIDRAISLALVHTVELSNSEDNDKVFVNRFSSRLRLWK
jgi:hypothetical protein